MPRRHFRYKTQSFYFPANLSSAQQLRLEAVVTFLQQQPEVLNELFSGKDFEFLWQAAIYFSRASSTENEHMNIPTQQIKLPHETSIQWTRSRVPLRNYFSEYFTFLQRKLQAVQCPTRESARALLSQPCDLQSRTCNYAGNQWYCFVPTSRSNFVDELLTILQSTACYRQQAWSLAEFRSLWTEIQSACCLQNADELLHLDRSYLGQRWRRRIASRFVIVVAELLHYLHAQPAMSLAEFLRCFDACMPYPAAQWDFRCLSSTDRLARLAAACASTSLEPRFYASDMQSAGHSSDPRRLRLAEAAQAWPAAIQTPYLLAHLHAYRHHFEDCLAPPAPCAFCACPSWNTHENLVDLRALPCGLPHLHSLLSGQFFLERYRAMFADFSFPTTFIGLTLEHLQNQFPPLPQELHQFNPVSCPFLSFFRAQLSSYFFPL